MHFILIKNKARNKIAISREEGKQQGKEEWLAEGLEKGLEKVKEEGIAEGKLENQKQIALNMKNQGFTKDVIAKCLNISINELEQLLNS